MTLEEFASRLVNPKPTTKKNGAGYISQCPSCAEKGADQKGKDHLLTVLGKDSWLHVKCLIGCSEDDIVRALGITHEDRRTEQRRENEEPCNLYTDEFGRYRFEKQRYYDQDGKKLFFQFCRSKDGIPIPKVPNKKGTGERFQKPSEADVDTNVLYRLPDILSAIKRGEEIYVNEGEKASRLMWSKGHAATCQPHGAGPGKWLTCYTDWFKGAKFVWIVADRDSEGEKYAAEVMISLRAAKIPCAIVRSKTLNAKDDAYDHITAGFTAKEFVPAPDLHPQRGIAIRYFNGEFKPVIPEFLVDPYLPKGKCVLLDADGGTGKTSLAVAWCAALSRGVHPLTFKPLEQGPIKILYLHKKEDQDDEIETVYRGNRGVPGSLLYGGDGLLLDSPGVAAISETIEEHGVKLVVMDALFYFLAGLTSRNDTNDNMLAIRVVGGLNDIASHHGITFWNIRHTSKGLVGKSASDMGMGSVAFRNSHRGQLVARWHPEKSGVVVVTDEKGSLLVERGEFFAYRRDGVEVQYIQGLTNPFEGKKDASSPATSAKAEEFIREHATGKYVASHELYEAAKSQGISKSTLERAMRALGVQAKRFTADGPWYRILPADQSTIEGPEEPYDEFAD